MDKHCDTDSHDPIEAQHATTLNVSTIICTRGRRTEPLDTLSQFQPYRDPGDEFILVDQNTDVEIQYRLQEACVKCQAHYVQDQPKGLPHARNMGASVANGDILLFCDDDVVLQSNLVEKHRKWYANSIVGGVAGRVIQARTTPRPLRWDRAAAPRLSFWLGSTVGHFDHDRPMQIEHIPGGNMSVRRAAWEQVGGSDERYGPVHSVLEDADLACRIRAAGYQLVFDPYAVLLHLASPSGGDQVRSISRYVFWYTRNMTLFYRQHLFSTLTLPIFLSIRAARCLGFAITSGDIVCLIYGIKGIVAGWRASKEGTGRQGIGEAKSHPSGTMR